MADDAREGRGPLQGLAAGLAAVRDRADAAYASSTDVPLLHPRFIRRVLAALDDDVDVVLPEVGGFRHPLAAAYRTELADVVERLIASDRMRPAPALVAAATVGEAAGASGLSLDGRVVASVNGDEVTRDPHAPLAAGDSVAFLSTDAGD